jgi:hypothetical protein
MVPGKLYVCKRDIRITGRLADGREAFSLVPEGSPVIPIMGPEGTQSVLIDGAVVPTSWESSSWKLHFREADGD